LTPGNPTSVLVCLIQIKLPVANPHTVLLFKLKGKTRIEITKAATFGDMLDAITVTLQDCPQIQVTIRRSLQRPIGWMIDQSAFCFHDWCYDVLRWGV
jgi:hypothetical protein